VSPIAEDIGLGNPLLRNLQRRCLMKEQTLLRLMRVSMAFRKYLNIPFGTPDFSLGTPLGNIGLDQRSPNFFARRPHRLLHNSSRAGRLCNVTVSCYDTFYQIKTCFVNIFFHDWQNVFRSDKMASRAGFGRRAVVWRPEVSMNH